MNIWETFLDVSNFDQIIHEQTSMKFYYLSWADTIHLYAPQLVWLKSISKRGRRAKVPRSIVLVQFWSRFLWNLCMVFFFCHLIACQFFIIMSLDLKLAFKNTHFFSFKRRQPVVTCTTCTCIYKLNSNFLYSTIFLFQII